MAWGIDVEGRPMDFAPWVVNISGECITPTRNEIDSVYGINGSAVAETLEYFETCGGDTERLVAMLNSHVIDRSYQITRAELLDAERWYTNEYYFYYIMFTKKIIGRYDFRFGEGKDEQLSRYHRKYEQGYLHYSPYGQPDVDASNALPSAFYTTFTAKYPHFTDFLDWAEVLCLATNAPSYKDDVFHIHDVWINSDFILFLHEFTRILTNLNDMFTIIEYVYSNFRYTALTLVPRKFLPIAIKKMLLFTTSSYNIHTKNQGNELLFDITRNKSYDLKKFDLYYLSAKEITNKATVAGIYMGISNSYSRSPVSGFELLTPIDGDHVTFKIRFLSPMRFVRLISGVICALFWVLIGLINSDTNITKHVAYIFAVISTMTLTQLIPLFLYERNITKYLMKHTDKNETDKENTIIELRNLSSELMTEKKTLEEKVRQRTAEIEQVNQKLRDYDKSKTDFFYNVSHELRTPLTLIKAPLEAMRNGSYGKTPEKQKPVLDMALRNVERLHEQVDMLLEFAKIDQKRIDVELIPVNLSELCAFYVSELSPRADSLGISLSLDTQNCSDQPFIASVDMKLFERAFFNLALNALKFTPRGSSVRIALIPSGDTIELSFADTGIGIPKDKLDFIFERFAQLDASSTRKYEGTGIGLALVKEICGIIGATIRVESELGKGSVFTISLKRVQGECIHLGKYFSPKRTTSGEKSMRHETLEDVTNSHRKLFSNELKHEAKLTILLVEDTEDMRHFLRDFLSERYRVIEAANGIEALEAWHRESKIDLIITDIMMPLMDGRELYRKISEETGSCCVPCLFLTARASSDEKIEAMSEGAIDYIFKPFLVEEVLAKTSALLRLMDGQGIRIQKEIENRILGAIQGNTVSPTPRLNIDSFGFSAREREVAIMVIEGKRNKEVASGIGLSEHTVSHHIESIYKKTNTRNRLEFINLFKT